MQPERLLVSPDLFTTLHDQPTTVVWLLEEDYPWPFRPHAVITVREWDRERVPDPVPAGISRAAATRHGQTGRFCQARILAVLDDRRFVRPGIFGLVLQREDSPTS